MPKSPFPTSRTCLRRVDVLAFKQHCSPHCPEIGNVFDKTDRGQRHSVFTHSDQRGSNQVARHRQQVRSKCVYRREDSKLILGPLLSSRGCKGVGGCQFKSLLEAKTFCDDAAECTAISFSPLGSGCERGFGCYRAVSASVSSQEVDSAQWKAANGRTYVKLRCAKEYENVCVENNDKQLHWKKLPRPPDDAKAADTCIQDARCSGFMLTTRFWHVRMAKGKARWPKYDIRYALGKIPTGTYSLNKGCPRGYEEIRSSEDCSEAHSSLKVRSRWLTRMNRSVNMLWNNRPSGCWWHTKSKNIHYNYQDTRGQKLQGDDRVICGLSAPSVRETFVLGKAPPGGARSSSTNSLLCPRGYSHILDKAVCTSAYTYLKARVLRGSTLGAPRGWDDRAQGCFWHSRKKTVRFNLRKPTKRLKGGDVVICQVGKYRAPFRRSWVAPTLSELRMTKRVCVTAKGGCQTQPSLVFINLAVTFTPKSEAMLLAQPNAKTLFQCKMRCITTYRCSVMAWTRKGACVLRLSRGFGTRVNATTDRTYTLGSAPRGIFFGNAGCPKGYSIIADVATCDEAMDRLKKSLKVPADVRRGETAAYSGQPFGCLLRGVNEVLFNLRSNLGKTLLGTTRVICEYGSRAVRSKYILSEAPTGRYKEHKGCPEGFTSVWSSAQCTEAVDFLKVNLNFQDLVRNADINVNDRPMGCWWHTNSRYVHFNVKNPSGSTLTGDDAVICARDKGYEQSCKRVRKVPLHCLREVGRQTLDVPNWSSQAMTVMNLCADTAVKAKWVQRESRVKVVDAEMTCRWLGAKCLGMAWNQGNTYFRMATAASRLLKSNIMYKVGGVPTGVYDMEEGCPTGFKTIEDVETCEDALAQLGKVRRGNDQIWMNRPPGCFIGWSNLPQQPVSVHGWGLSFNFHDNMKGNILAGNDRVVCEFHSPSVGSKYVLGTAPSYLFTADKGCPRGYRTIGTPSTCAKAFAFLRKRVGTLRHASRGEVARWKDRPPGCTLSLGINKVVFNTETSLGMRLRGLDAVICLRAPFGTKRSQLRAECNVQESSGQICKHMNSRCLRGLEVEARYSPCVKTKPTPKQKTCVQKPPVLGVTFDNICVDNKPVRNDFGNSPTHRPRKVVPYRDALAMCLGTYRCSAISCEGFNCALQLVSEGMGHRRNQSIMYALGLTSKMSSCPPGYTGIADVRTCDHAYATMMNADLSDTLRDVDLVWTKERPPGCFLHRPSRKVHFNYAGTWKGDMINNDSSVICEWDRPPPRPEYILAQAPLGKYKRQDGCPRGFVTIEDGRSCSLAYQTLYIPGAIRDVDRPMSDRPFGCTIDYATKRVSFNPLNTVGRRMRGRDVAICRIATRRNGAAESKARMNLSCLVRIGGSKKSRFDGWKSNADNARNSSAKTDPPRSLDLSPVYHRSVCVTLKADCSVKPVVMKSKYANTDLACRLACVKQGFKCVEAKFYPVHNACFLKMSSCWVKAYRPNPQWTDS
eukprot:TRINITY_DN8091_c0_g1_i4.p1 TRINITY_DN8091_c0_g1~~TRINITY_DN8091_c0_g1_i4.p1  ORF type:complete len:1676 (+),score=122.81 TRINITY_DN8091_c0_g1_i4:593-5029(+)